MIWLNHAEWSDPGGVDSLMQNATVGKVKDARRISLMPRAFTLRRSASAAPFEADWTRTELSIAVSVGESVIPRCNSCTPACRGTCTGGIRANADIEVEVLVGDDRASLGRPGSAPRPMHSRRSLATLWVLARPHRRLEPTELREAPAAN